MADAITFPIPDLTRDTVPEPLAECTYQAATVQTVLLTGAVTEPNALKPRAENAGSKPLLELQNRNASWLCSPLTNLSSL